MRPEAKAVGVCVCVWGGSNEMFNMSMPASKPDLQCKGNLSLRTPLSTGALSDARICVCECVCVNVRERLGLIV